MGYVLYGANGSGSSIVEIALAEIGADYALEIVDAANAAHRDAAYAAVNPHRKLPTLVTPEGDTLTESAAIAITLAERHPDSGLLPPPASAARARALRWMLFAAAELYPIVEIMDHPERFAPDEATRPGVRDTALQIWRSRWRTVEGSLGEASAAADSAPAGPFLLGQTFCVADVYLAALSRWDLEADWRAANIPKLERLAAAVAKRPKIRELWPKHFPAG
ncbi:MAG: glutathione S-transferase family protein [Myxococcota bacterium]